MQPHAKYMPKCYFIPKYMSNRLIYITPSKTTTDMEGMKNNLQLETFHYKHLYLIEHSSSIQLVHDHDEDVYTQEAESSPADNDEELDDEQGVREGAVGLGGV